jgi:uncharacterized protein YjiK
MRTAIIISSFIIIVFVTVVIIRFTTNAKNPAGKETPSAVMAMYGKIPEITIANKWDMPDILKEISAISYIDTQRFACVQDELGTIFIYNTNTGTIEKEIPFGPPGDYEGIALNETTAYVLRADGQIFEVKQYVTGKPIVTLHHTPLTEKHDTEGLAFDKTNNRLLIAVKGDDTHEGYKGIYSFDLNLMKLSAEPEFKINLQHQLFADLEKSKKRKKKAQFNPSEIALHPTTGDMYVTDGGEAKLLIMNKSGNIVLLTDLQGKEFSQAEGITFSPDGRMFISNEAGKKAGNILEVNVR